MRYYLVVVKITSQDTEDRLLTPYDNKDTAERKFHEAFNTIGSGPKKVCAMLLNQDFGIVRSEVWSSSSEVTPVEGE